MAARDRGLGPVRALGVVLALLLAAVLSGFGATPAASLRASGAALDPIDVPMTGKLPICPAQMATFSPSDVWVEDHLFNQFGNLAELGLLNSCAMQNWQDPDDNSSFPRAVDAKAVPDEISISSEPITVQIQATPLAVPEGGFNNWAPDCMPRSTRPGGCVTSDFGYFVAYRLANGAGQYVGRWTLAGLSQPNPYFDLTRGSCPDQHPEWDDNYEHDGIPCTWTLRFVTNAQGAPVLTTGMQVVLAMHLRSGTQTANGITGPEYDALGVVPMIFQPGASTALDLQPSASTVRSGKTLTLSAHAQGPQPGTPVNFYRRPAGGAWSFLGQALTDSSGKARLGVKMTTSAAFYARLASGGVETTRSPDRAVVATRSVSLKSSPAGHEGFLFVGKVRPADGAGKVQLQLLTKKGWKTVERGRVKDGKVSWTLDVPDGRSSWRLLTRATTQYGESVSKKRTVAPDG